MSDSNDRLAKLEERKKQIEAQIQQIKARHSQRQRKTDTRRKILVGSYYLERVERENRMEELKRAMDPYLTRNLDRALFNLPPLPEPDSAPAQAPESVAKSSPTPPTSADTMDWITFGGPMIKSGDPVEQTKRIKYMNLVANAIMLQNVVDLTEVLNEMIREGFKVTPALISRLSPYMRRQLLRFGRYVLNEDTPEPLQPKSIQLAT